MLTGSRPAERLKSARGNEADCPYRPHPGSTPGRDEAGKLIPIDLKTGDRVLFGKWSGTEVRIDGEDLLIMKESDIMGVVEQSIAKKVKSLVGA